MIIIELLGAALVGGVIGWFANSNKTTIVTDATKVEEAVAAEVAKVVKKGGKPADVPTDKPATTA